jgi:protein NrfD
MVLFLFLTHLGIGIVFTLLWVSREAGVKFFRFNAGLAALLIAAGFAFRPVGDGSLAERVSIGALVLLESALVMYWATVGRTLVSIRSALRWTAFSAGVVALVAQAIRVTADWGFTFQALTVASFISSAAFLGGTCTAMILGHWYLVVPSLQIDHLQSIVKLHIVSMVIRIAVVAAAILVAVLAWQPDWGVPSFDRYVFSVSGVFFWQRVLFGLAGPILLSYLTWETAKIRSTQSATGILYVDFFTVVVGEALAKYLLLATRVPV